MLDDLSGTSKDDSNIPVVGIRIEQIGSQDISPDVLDDNALMSAILGAVTARGGELTGVDGGVVFDDDSSLAVVGRPCSPHFELH